MEWSWYGDLEEIESGCPQVVIANEVDTGGDQNSCDEGGCSGVVFPFVGIRCHTVIDPFIDLCVEGMLAML